MRRLGLIIIAVLCCVTMLAVPTAEAGPKGKGGGGNGGGNGDGGNGGGGLPTAIVTMGDSYISGEAGRWQGNSNATSPDRDGTDRATFKRRGQWNTDLNRVYLDGTGDSGCHRSDVSEALSTTIAVDARINLACSGATTDNVILAASGGSWFKGEAPQADQLAALTATHDVALIVLSIGGNDLGFSDVIIDCTVRYNTSPSWWQNTCNGPQQSNIDAAMPGAMAGVAQAIADIQAVMAAAGDTDYRLVLQSYPSPIPRAGEFRYSESGWSRTNTGGCPFWDVDANWARDSLVPQISDNLAAVAAAAGVEFLDLSDMLEDREVCSVHTAQGSGSNAEWARWLGTGLTQGEAQESMHPNALGQQAAARCVDLVYAAAPGSYRCTNTPGQGPGGMAIS